MGNLFKRVTREGWCQALTLVERVAGNPSVLFPGRTFESLAMFSN